MVDFSRDVALDIAVFVATWDSFVVVVVVVAVVHGTDSI